MRTAFEYEAASALMKGQRDYQEDAIISDFARGSDIGLVVLADGMGGHAAGDVASRIVVTEVFSELVFQRADPDRFEPLVPQCLRTAAMAANTCLRNHVRDFPETRGMGATLVAGVILREKLYWISIGDSPLFLFRDGVLTQLNEDHSMAPQIDFMVKSGLMSAEEGMCHPDRNVLTSVLFGEEIPKIDCPDDPVGLCEDDILIVASDGLQYLSNEQIQAALRRNCHLSSNQIVDSLLQQVTGLEDPDLDNVSLSLVKFQRTVADRSSDVLNAPRSEMRCVG
ncbi:MAG: protein phosphatase 2C domain-containing protein [Pseudomonadota bacterium]